MSLLYWLSEASVQPPGLCKTSWYGNFPWPNLFSHAPSSVWQTGWVSEIWTHFHIWYIYWILQNSRDTLTLFGESLDADVPDSAKLMATVDVKQRSRFKAKGCASCYGEWLLSWSLPCDYLRPICMKGCPPSISVYISRKLAVASWSYSCFSKGRGRSESNTVIFHSNPPQVPGAFWSSDGSRWSRAQFWSVSRQSVFSISKSHQNPIMFPGLYEP